MKNHKQTQTLQEILAWLKSIERQAADCYTLSAQLFPGDPELSAFLTKMAEEETEHYELLELLEQGDSKGFDIPPFLLLDTETKEKIETPFVRIMAQIDKGELTRQEMVRAIAEAEFCEWNELFLYVVDALRGGGRECQKMVSEIEKHRREIEQFLGSLPEGAAALAEFGRLQTVWQRRVLVVEDEPAIAAFLNVLLRNEAEVVIADNGKEGLTALRDGHFDVVISDVEMPLLNGIDLYHFAARIDLDLPQNFIFFTGTERPEYLSFLSSIDAVIVPKLTSMVDFRRLVKEVAER